MATQNGIAQATTSAFRRSVTVAIDIGASPERVWGRLTNATDMPRWNSTVSSIEGSVALGQRLKLKVPISDRTFKVKVDVCEPGRHLVWSDGNAVFRGVRTYTLNGSAGGATRFAVEEVFTGFMLPLIARSLPLSA